MVNKYLAEPAIVTASGGSLTYKGVYPIAWTGLAIYDVCW